MILEIGNRRLLIGIEWLIEANAKAAGAAAKSHPGRLSLKHKLPDKKVLLGLAPEGARLSKNMIPGALALATSVREGLVCHEIPGTDLVWLCAISDGAPLPGFDEVLEKSAYRTRASEVMTYYPNATLIGNLPGSQVSLLEILATADKKRLDALKIRSPLFFPTIIGGGLLFLVAAAVGVNSHLERQALLKAEQERMQQEAAKAAMDSEAAKKLQMQELALFDSFKKEVATARQAVSNYRSADEYLERWTAIYNSVPDMIGGFRLQSFSCNEEVCHACWVGISPWADPSVFDTIEGVSPGAKKVTGEVELHAPNVKSFTQVMRFDAPAPRAIPSGLEHDKMITQIRDVFYRLEPSLKQLGLVGFDIPNEPVDIVVEPPKDIAAKTKPVVIARGAKVSVVSNGASPLVLRDFLLEMHAPVNIEALGVSGLNGPTPTMAMAGIIRTPTSGEVVSLGSAPQPTPSQSDAAN